MRFSLMQRKARCRHGADRLNAVLPRPRLSCCQIGSASPRASRVAAPDWNRAASRKIAEPKIVIPRSNARNDAEIGDAARAAMVVAGKTLDALEVGAAPECADTACSNQTLACDRQRKPCPRQMSRPPRNKGAGSPWHRADAAGWPQSRCNTRAAQRNRARGRTRLDGKNRPLPAG